MWHHVTSCDIVLERTLPQKWGFARALWQVTSSAPWPWMSLVHWVPHKTKNTSTRVTRVTRPHHPHLTARSDGTKSHLISSLLPRCYLRYMWVVTRLNILNLTACVEEERLSCFAIANDNLVSCQMLSARPKKWNANDSLRWLLFFCLC